MKQTNSDDTNLSMPSDQYGRYGLVAARIKELKRIKKQKKVTILDIGGYKGEIHRFFSAAEAEITIIDLYDSDDKNYVKGSALDLPFEDNKFDYVVSFEVFEHIPRKDRNRFISEAIRVGNGNFILTAPFSGENDEVLRSEQLVNKFWKSMHGGDHPWLKEHIEYRTPRREELELILDKQHLPFAAIGNNDLVLWNLMLSFNYLTTLYRGSGLNPGVQKFYNSHVNTLETNTDAYYRYIYTIGEDTKLLKDAPRTKEVPIIDKRHDMITLINEVFIQVAKDIKRESRRQQEEINTLSAELENRIKMHDELVGELRANERAMRSIRATSPVWLARRARQSASLKFRKSPKRK